MKNVCGPITVAKTIYEDDERFLIIIGLPFVDRKRVKVTWKNSSSHCVMKILCVSMICMTFIKRHDRTFKLLVLKVVILVVHKEMPTFVQLYIYMKKQSST